MKQWITKRTIGISVAVVLIVVVAGAVWVRSSAKSYTDEVAVFKQQLASAYAEQKKDFDRLPANASNTDAAAAMRQSEVRLQGVLDHAPKQPLALVLPAASNTKAEAHALQAAAQDLKTALHNTQAYVVYETAVRETLAAINSQGNDTPAEQQALAAVWKENTARLEKLPVPEGAEAAHNKLLEQFKDTDTVLANMVAAYQKQDFNQYISNSDKLDANIADLQETGKAFTQLGRTYDQSITTAYDRLGGLVR